METNHSNWCEHKPVWIGRDVGEHFGDTKQLDTTKKDSNGKPFVLQLYDGRIRVVGVGPEGRGVGV